MFTNKLFHSVNFWIMAGLPNLWYFFSYAFVVKYVSISSTYSGQLVGQSERFRVIEIQKCEICFFSPFMLTLFPHFCTTFIKSPFLGQSWSTNYCCTCPAPVEFDPSLNVKRFETEKIKFLVNKETWNLRSNYFPKGKFSKSRLILN